jgi:hypothetical protein
VCLSGIKAAQRNRDDGIRGPEINRRRTGRRNQRQEGRKDRRERDVRMLVDKGGDIVDLVVDDDVDVLFGDVFADLLECELLVGGHGERRGRDEEEIREV